MRALPLFYESNLACSISSSSFCKKKWKWKIPAFQLLFGCRLNYPSFPLPSLFLKLFVNIDDTTIFTLLSWNRKSTWECPSFTVQWIAFIWGCKTATTAHMWTFCCSHIQFPRLYCHYLDEQSGLFPSVSSLLFKSACLNILACNGFRCSVKLGLISQYALHLFIM